MAVEQIQLPTLSMWTNTPVYRDKSGDRVFGLLRLPVNDPGQMLEVFQVTAGFVERLDKISMKFYGTPDLWWLIAAANKIVDPISEVTLGKQLQIPRR